MGLDMGVTMKINLNKEGYQENEMIYWRKANQIRDWFVRKLGADFQDEGITKINKDILLELKEDCEKVLRNHDLAETLLPTSSGFFFGSTDYDEWYFENLEDTCSDINRTLIDINDVEKIHGTEKIEIYYWEWY